MYKIGTFSKINKITIKALRYYDETGLLKPEFVDDSTGYRYYTSSQLPRLHKIMALRNIGFSIEEIKEILNVEMKEETAGTEIEFIFEKRRKVLESYIASSKEQLSQINHYLRDMKEDFTMTYQVLVKELPEVTVFYKRTHVDSYDDYFQLIPSIGNEIAKANPNLKCAEPEYCFIIYHDGEYRERDIDIEFCEAVTDFGIETDTIHFKKVDRVPEAACVFHKGPYKEIRNAYSALFKWIEENDYIVCDNPRESYIDGIWNKESEAGWLTEVQVPIAKRYSKETSETWGDSEAYKESVEKTSQYKNEDWIRVMQDAKNIMKQFASLVGTNPASEEAQDLVKQWQQYISKNMYHCTDVILKGLGQMYLADQRFQDNIDENGSGTAEFMSKAIQIYCNHIE